VPTLPSAADVTALTGTSLSESVVTSIIADAALIVESTCFNAYAEARQTAIIKWVAAHMVANTNATGVVTSEKLGDASVTYGRQVAKEGLAGTMFGQQALALDTNGCLTGIGRGKASFERI